ncbi:hypothetical protein DL769_008950 [Monosporascus sp. CRB-8-3]|nr:hypothetical protein DL769_008950 [Monosporascus sp. CRB-8-3]
MEGGPQVPEELESRCINYCRPKAACGHLWFALGVWEKLNAAGLFGPLGNPEIEDGWLFVNRECGAEIWTLAKKIWPGSTRSSCGRGCIDAKVKASLSTSEEAGFFAIYMNLSRRGGGYAVEYLTEIPVERYREMTRRTGMEWPDMVCTTFICR